jgi:hypothetical protein
MQIAQHHFNSKTVYKKQRTAGGMPHLKPTDFDVTKHSDSFVWKDTTERVARRCEDIVDKKRVRVEQPKISPKNPGNALSDALLISRFQKFVADAAPRGFLKLRFAWFQLMSWFELIWGQRFWEVVFFTGERGRQKKLRIPNLITFRTQETDTDRCWPNCLGGSPPVDLFSFRGYSPFPQRSDLDWSSEWESKSWVVKAHVSSQMCQFKRDLWWPSRILIPISKTILSLIFSENGLMMIVFLTFKIV